MVCFHGFIDRPRGPVTSIMRGASTLVIMALRFAEGSMTVMVTSGGSETGASPVREERKGVVANRRGFAALKAGVRKSGRLREDLRRN